MFHLLMAFILITTDEQKDLHMTLLMALFKHKNECCWKGWKEIAMANIRERWWWSLGVWLLVTNWGHSHVVKQAITSRQD